MEDAFRSLIHDSNGCLKTYCNAGGDINLRNYHGDTLLIAAIKDGKEAKAREIIEIGCDVNKPDVNGRTPLAWCARMQHTHLLEYLEDHGAFVDQTKDRQLLLDATVLTGSISMINFANENGLSIRGPDGNFLLVEFILKSNFEASQFLIQNGIDVNHPDATGRLPIVESVRNPNVKIINVLITEGTDVNQLDGQGRLPIVESIQRTDIIDLLIVNGADVNKRDRNGRVVIAESAKMNNMERVSYFIEKGADINQKGEDDRVAISHAILNGNIDMVDKLLELGADCNIPDVFKNSPLDITINHHQKQLALAERILRHPKAVVNINKHLYNVCFNRYSNKYLSMLISYGADPFQVVPEVNMTSFEKMAVCISFFAKTLVDTDFVTNPKWIILLKECPCVTSHMRRNPIFKLLTCKSFKLFHQYFCSHADELVSVEQIRWKPIQMQRFSNNILNMVVQVIKLGAVFSTQNIWKCSEEKCLCAELRHKFKLNLNELFDKKLTFHRIQTGSPTSLLQQCRTAIRKSLGLSCVRKVKQLPLPNSLLKFLLFEKEL